MQLLIQGLPTVQAQRLWSGGPDANGQPPLQRLAQGGANPCRHCLGLIADGEPKLVLSYRPFDTAQPYAEAGPIFLHAQACQGRLELVRRIGQKALLRGQRVVQALQQVVHRGNEGRHFERHRAVVQRGEVVGVARADALLQLVERLDAPRQRQPHQQHGQRQDHELRQHHALDDFGGQHAALFARLGHLHQRHGGIWQGQAHPDVGDADLDTAHFAVAQAHLAGHGHLVGGRLGQLALAGEELPAGAQHLVVDDVGLIGPQDLAGRLGQVELHLVARHAHQLGKGVGVVFERPVKRLVGQALRHQPGQRQADGPQQQQRREHPVEDFAEQGSLLSLEYFQGVRRGGFE